MAIDKEEKITSSNFDAIDIAQISGFLNIPTTFISYCLMEALVNIAKRNNNGIKTTILFKATITTGINFVLSVFLDTFIFTIFDVVIGKQPNDDELIDIKIMGENIFKQDQDSS